MVTLQPLLSTFVGEASVHPAIAGDARTIVAAEERRTAGLLHFLEVLVDPECGLGDTSHVAVVDDLDAPGALLEIVLDEGQVITRSQVLRIAGGIHGVVGTETDLVPVFATLARMAAAADHAEAGDQGPVGQREL